MTKVATRPKRCPIVRPGTGDPLTNVDGEKVYCPRFAIEAFVACFVTVNGYFENLRLRDNTYPGGISVRNKRPVTGALVKEREFGESGTLPGASLAFAVTLAGQHHFRCTRSSTFGPKWLSGSVLDPAFRVIERVAQEGSPERVALLSLPSLVSRHPEGPGVSVSQFHERFFVEDPFKDFFLVRLIPFKGSYFLGPEGPLGPVGFFGSPDFPNLLGGRGPGNFPGLTIIFGGTGRSAIWFGLRGSLSE